MLFLTFLNKVFFRFAPKNPVQLFYVLGYSRHVIWWVQLLCFCLRCDRSGKNSYNVGKSGRNCSISAAFNLKHFYFIQTGFELLWKKQVVWFYSNFSRNINKNRKINPIHLASKLTVFKFKRQSKVDRSLCMCVCLFSKISRNCGTICIFIQSLGNLYTARFQFLYGWAQK